MLPNIHPCWCGKRLSFKDALNARTQAVSCQSHNSPQIWDLASVKGPRCNMKEKTSKLEACLQKTQTYLLRLFPPLMLKKCAKSELDHFPQSFEIKKKLPAFTLCSDRLSQQSARFDRNNELQQTNCPSSRQAMKKSAYQDWFQRNKPLTAPTQHRNRFGLPRRFSNTLIKWVIEWLCDQFWGRIHVLFNSCSNQIVQKLPWIFCSKSFETAQLS